jgi:ssRNA-specific RNase YbeY (16S rRNA maturation enzyme)
LHLIGYDHATQADYDAMFALQDDLLKGWWT